MKKHIYILTCILLSAWMLRAQDSLNIVDGRLLEEILENQDEEAEYDFLSLYDDLQTYLEHPLNLNHATYDEFYDLTMLTEEQIAAIIDYRAEYGDFLSPYELQVIPEMDMATLRALTPLVTTGSSGNIKNFSTLVAELKHNVFVKYKRILETKAGYDRAFEDGGYIGDPNHYYMRYRGYAGQNIKLGVTMEKDAGEAFFADPNQNGFDFYSGHVYLQDLHPIFSTVVVGDYSVSMGQGLILHNSFGAGKSSYVMNVKRGGRSLRAYSSVNEANFFRGGATTLQLSSESEATVFVSTKHVDGSGIVKDSIIDTGFDSFNTLNISGLHRTATELERKSNVRQTDMGITTQYRKRNFKVGIHGLLTTFDKAINLSELPYKKFNFNGDRLINASVDYSYRYRNMSIFGETAMSDNLAVANIHGLLLSLGRNVDASLVYRNYPRNYHVLNANAFAESTLPINEHGLYMGLRFKPTNELTISTYYDQWKHPWLRFRKDAPSGGKEFLVKIDYYKKRQYNVYLQYRYEGKQENGTDVAQGIDPIVDLNQHRARLHLSYKVSKALELRNRVEYSYYQKEDTRSHGYLLYQDVIYKPLSFPLSFTARYAVFDNDFNSRIYAYENDILYEFSIPFYSGRGSRFYLNLRYKVNRWLTAESHYGYVFYPEAANNPEFSGIGSGLERIEGNRRTDLKFQLKFRF